jgi:prepilin-type N-terminal cleavage/methylation domain-containing protein
MRRTRPSSRHGFTIIELVIVIAIIGILAVLSIPNMSAWIGRMRLNQGTAHLQSTVENARRLALSTGKRYCLRLNTDPDYANGQDNAWLIGTVVQEETAPNSNTWTTLAAPPELAGWTNNATTDLHRAITLEGSDETTTFDTIDGCQGLVFNTFGYSANPVTDFTEPCGGQNCARLTLRNKGAIGPIEQRTLWIDRGGNVRVTISPSTPPVLGS